MGALYFVSVFELAHGEGLDAVEIHGKAVPVGQVDAVLLARDPFRVRNGQIGLVQKGSIRIGEPPKQRIEPAGRLPIGKVDLSALTIRRRRRRSFVTQLKFHVIQDELARLGHGQTLPAHRAVQVDGHHHLFRQENLWWEKEKGF